MSTTASMASVMNAVNGEPCRLVGTGVRREYVGGKPTDNVIGVTYDVVFPCDQFARLSVKIDGTEKLVVEQALLDEANLANRVVLIKFSGVFAKPYSSNNQVFYTVTAESAELVTDIGSKK